MSKELDPKSIIEKYKSDSNRTIIIEYLYQGKGWASFFSVLSKWAIFDFGLWILKQLLSCSLLVQNQVFLGLLPSVGTKYHQDDLLHAE